MEQACSGSCYSSPDAKDRQLFVDAGKATVHGFHRTPHEQRHPNFGVKIGEQGQYSGPCWSPSAVHWIEVGRCCLHLQMQRQNLWVPHFRALHHCHILRQGSQIVEEGTVVGTDFAGSSPLPNSQLGTAAVAEKWRYQYSKQEVAVGWTLGKRVGGMLMASSDMPDL